MREQKTTRGEIFIGLLRSVLEEFCPNRRFEVFFALKNFLNWIKEEEKKQKELSHELFELLKERGDKEAIAKLKELNQSRATFFYILKRALTF